MIKTKTKMFVYSLNSLYKKFLVDMCLPGLHVVNYTHKDLKIAFVNYSNLLLTFSDFWSNICVSNTEDSVSMGYPNTKKRVENTVWLTAVFG